MKVRVFTTSINTKEVNKMRQVKKDPKGRDTLFVEEKYDN